MSFLALKRFNGKTEKGITFLYLKSASQPSVKMMLDNPNQGAQDHSSLADRIYSAEALWRQKWPEGSHTDCRSWFSQWRASLPTDSCPTSDLKLRGSHAIFWKKFLSILENWRKVFMKTFTFKYAPDEPSLAKQVTTALHGKPTCARMNWLLKILKLFCNWLQKAD